MKGFQLRLLRLNGPGKVAAEIEFGSGLTVISGPSDTGKSYMLELIDFMLGGASLPRPIPESIGYTSADLHIETYDGMKFELSRSLAGGAFLERRVDRNDKGDVLGSTRTLADKHNAKNNDNISAFLLEHVGLRGSKVKTNKNNKLADLSFRYLAPLVIIDEQEIIRQISPVHGGQHIETTLESSVLKLLLTGQDDSALVEKREPKVVKAEIEGQLALLDQLIAEAKAQLISTPKEHILAARLGEVGNALIDIGQTIEDQRRGIDLLEGQRQIAWRERERRLSRASDVDGLIERFVLLDHHYETDIDRLNAVAETAAYFTALDVVACPLCGAKRSAAVHDHDGLPNDADIVLLRHACGEEIAKIIRLRHELAQTLEELHRERSELAEGIDLQTRKFNDANAAVRKTLSPALATASSKSAALSAERNTIQTQIAAYARISFLQQKRFAIEAGLQNARQSRVERQSLPRAITNTFANCVSDILMAWHFPLNKPAVFDDRTEDILLDSRRRGEQGKGLRALTHAAFSIGLLVASRKLGTLHPGFVILDSPLVTLREPDPADRLPTERNLEVKQAFYQDLADRAHPNQIVVFENDDPEQRLADSMKSVRFTKRIGHGRYGFFIPTDDMSQ